MRQPIAMMASNGAVDAAWDCDWVVGREVRSVVEEPRRSPAEREEVCVDWIWEAEKSLEVWEQHG